MTETIKEQVNALYRRYSSTEMTWSEYQSSIVELIEQRETEINRILSDGMWHGTALGDMTDGQWAEMRASYTKKPAVWKMLSMTYNDGVDRTMQTWVDTSHKLYISINGVSIPLEPLFDMEKVRKSIKKLVLYAKWTARQQTLNGDFVVKAEEKLDGEIKFLVSALGIE